MKIRIKGDVANARGAFQAGDVVEWPDSDAQPLVDGGIAEIYTEPKPKKPPAGEA